MSYVPVVGAHLKAADPGIHWPTRPPDLFVITKVTMLGHDKDKRLVYYIKLDEVPQIPNVYWAGKYTLDGFFSAFKRCNHKGEADDV